MAAPRCSWWWICEPNPASQINPLTALVSYGFSCGRGLGRTRLRWNYFTVRFERSFCFGQEDNDDKKIFGKRPIVGLWVEWSRCICIFILCPLALSPVASLASSKAFSAMRFFFRAIFFCSFPTLQKLFPFFSTDIKILFWRIRKYVKAAFMQRKQRKFAESERNSGQRKRNFCVVFPPPSSRNCFIFWRTLRKNSPPMTIFQH